MPAPPIRVSEAAGVGMLLASVKSAVSSCTHPSKVLVLRCLYVSVSRTFCISFPSTDFTSLSIALPTSVSHLVIAPSEDS